MEALLTSKPPSELEKQIWGVTPATITRDEIGWPPPHLIPSGGGHAPTTDRRVTRRRDDAKAGEFDPEETLS
jgi:hypothetical protein